MAICEISDNDLVELAKSLKDDISGFMQSLRVDDNAGRFLPCRDGVTDQGKKISLGFSCLALKTCFMLGLWDQLKTEDKDSWIRYIKSFQTVKIKQKSRVLDEAFLDSTRHSFLIKDIPWHRRTFNIFSRQNKIDYPERVVLAETKQAIATLAEVRERPDRIFMGFPHTLKDLDVFLKNLDWSKPWSAGGQASALAVFVKTEAPRFLTKEDSDDLSRKLMTFFDHIADPETGSYFKGSVPSIGQIVNGSMKVLTGLDWLEDRIHYPEKLIDTCLSELPEAEGCHTVDWIYVLYRCSLETPHRRDEVVSACRGMIDQIMRHRNSDGGFSSRIKESKSHYYSVRVSRGLKESDLHGTTLMTWALAMIFKIINNPCGWKVIRP